MVNCRNDHLIIKRLGFQRFSTISPQNHVGGIELLWNEVNIDVNVIAKEPQIMHYIVHDKPNRKQCMILTVYALAQKCEKDEFWDHLKCLHIVVKMPWCLLGSFSEMLLSLEKLVDPNSPIIESASLMGSYTLDLPILPMMKMSKVKYLLEKSVSRQASL